MTPPATPRPWRLDARPETVDDDPPVSRLMTVGVTTISPDTGVAAALRSMTDHGVRHLAVMDGARCRGVLLESDVIRAVAADVMADTHAGDVCRTLPTVRPDDRRSVAAQRMHTAGMDAVLVVDGGATAGIVTATDVITSLAQSTTASGTTTPGSRFREPGPRRR